MAKDTNSIVLELSKVYEHLAQQITTSASFIETLIQIKDLRSGGNQVEESVRATVKDCLSSKYHVGHGHVIDSKLNVSKQEDIIITDNTSYKNIIKTKDNTELFYYESVYSIGEVKSKLTVKSFISAIQSISDFRSRLVRKEVPNNAILTGKQTIFLDTELTTNKIRNPLFNFLIAINESNDLRKIAKIIEKTKWTNLPNITVILNYGAYVLIDKAKLEKKVLSVQLYPEFFEGDENYEWKFINVVDGGQNFAYLLACINEHLSSTILETPSFLTYAETMFEYNQGNIISLEDL